MVLESLVNSRCKKFDQSIEYAPKVKPEYVVFMFAVLGLRTTTYQMEVVVSTG